MLYREEKGIARVTFNRPEALNAIDKDLLQQLASILDVAKKDEAVKAVIITGAGEKAFSAGADIRFLNHASVLEVLELAQMAVSVNNRIETMGKVVVAAINGHALGGGLELAESCMLRVAVRHATLGHPEVRIGAVAGFGGTTRLPRLIGKGRAAELLLTGKLVSAEEAVQLGLITKVVETEALISETENLIHEILSQAHHRRENDVGSHSSRHESNSGRIGTSWGRLLWFGGFNGRLPGGNECLSGKNSAIL